MKNEKYFEDEAIEFGLQYQSDEQEAEEVITGREKRKLFSLEDGFYIMWNDFHKVNLFFWSEITGIAKDEIIKKARGKFIWLDHKKYEINPEDTYSHYSTKDELFSGNILAKYEELKEINIDENGIFDDTIRLYEDNLPENISGEDIHVGFGATWVPLVLLVTFVERLLQLMIPPVIEYNELSSNSSGWIVKCRIEPNKVLNRSTYGTERMSAIQIITCLLNGTPIKVSDYLPKVDGSGKQEVFNREETLKAKAKEQKILEEWYKFCHDNKAVEDMLQNVYMKRFGCTVTTYDGEGITLPEMNPEVRFYSYHKKAIEKIVMNNNVLLADKTGAGKTYEFCPAIFKLLQLGITEKAMIVVPNNNLDQTVNAYLKMFPSEKENILKIRPKVEFAPKRRKNTIKEMKSNKYKVIFMPFSSFDMLTLSKDYAFGLREQEIRECTIKMNNAKSIHSKAKYKSEIEKLKKKYDKYKASFKDSETAVFDLLGITLLCVDEAHNYKNCSIEYHGGNIIGFPKPSKKADNMLEKVRFIQKNNRRVIFSTATPITNSLVDVYTMQKYLQPEELKIHKIYHFNDWLKNYCTEETTFQVDVAARGKFVTRISKFHNLPELMNIFAKMTHFHDGVSGEFTLPEFKGYTDIAVEQSEELKIFMEEIVERIEQVHNHEVTRDEDNLLKITVQSRLAALDIRLIDPEVNSRNQPCKINRCADEVVKIYQDYPGTTQIIFSDMGTPKKDGFNVYDEMKYQLMERGIPESEIQFIHDADTDKKLNKMETDFNDAKVRVLIGSTKMLGVGKNVQRKLKAIHHLDVVWRPADFEQRNGRMERQGNENTFLLNYRYITERTLDAYCYQVLENKQRFISQFLSSSLDSSYREESDYADIVLSYGEIKALALGDNRIRQRVELANELEHAKINQREKKKELRKLEELKKTLPGKISDTKRFIIRIKRDIRHYENNKERISKDESQAFGEELLGALGKNIARKEERLFEIFQGFKVILPAEMKEGKRFVILQGENFNRYRVDIDTEKPIGCTMKVRNRLKNLKDTLDEQVYKLKDLQIQSEQVVRDLEDGNPYDKEVEELTKKLKKIDAELELEGGIAA